MTQACKTGENDANVCSVVCTTYNHSQYSREAIESIAKQDYPYIEIIVVDDGSTDGNSKVLSEALESSGRPYKLILQENTGNIPLNVNRGLAEATGSFVSMLSLDDALLPGCISSKMSLLCPDPNLAFIANTSLIQIDSFGFPINNDMKTILFNKNPSSSEELIEYEYSTIGCFFVQGAIFRHAVVRAFGGYDEDITGDDLIFRTKLFRWLSCHPEMRFAFQHRPGVAYRRHTSNIHQNTLRQVKTVVEWRNRYFPDRPLPERGVHWAANLLLDCLRQGRLDDIRYAVNLDPQIADIYKQIMARWPNHVRLVMGLVKRRLRFSEPILKQFKRPARKAF